ncbi:MAG: hypothetical protein PHE18_05095 [Candidatus Omnitrophica bacterium]|nr:hypothetical protein [Candidatus Omnitrophota bacterium]MDD5553234.1 hypothetical protein [Candidatus Omnitrophota bacterium]
MKRKILAVLLMMSLALVSGAFAQVTDIELTDEAGSTDFRDPPHIFGLDETPWLYVLLPQQSSVITGDWWLSGFKNQTEESFDSSNDPDPDFNYFSNNVALWVSRKDENRPGEWHIDSLEADGSRIPTHSINYKVTPEPVGSSLFFLGMSALVLRSLRRRKTD